MAQCLRLIDEPFPVFKASLFLRQWRLGYGESWLVIMPFIAKILHFRLGKLLCPNTLYWPVLGLIPAIFDIRYGVPAALQGAFCTQNLSSQRASVFNKVYISWSQRWQPAQPRRHHQDKIHGEEKEGEAPASNLDWLGVVLASGCNLFYLDCILLLLYVLCDLLVYIVLAVS